MTSKTVPKVTEITFRIRDEKITKNPVHLGADVQCSSSVAGQSASAWCIQLLEANGDFIEVSIWYSGGQRKGMYDSSFPADINLSLYKSMHFVPIADATKIVTYCPASLPKTLSGGFVLKGYISRAAVKTGPNALTSSFDIVLSTDVTMARTPHDPPVPQPLPPPVVKNQDILPFFLKDSHSVDICFLFPNDPKYPNHGLWAHRLVLSRSKIFAKVIENSVQQALAVEAEARVRTRAATVAAAVAATAATQVSSAPSSSTITSTVVSTVTMNEHTPQGTKGDEVRALGKMLIQSEDVDDSSSTSSFVDIDDKNNTAIIATATATTASEATALTPNEDSSGEENKVLTQTGAEPKVDAAARLDSEDVADNNDKNKDLNIDTSAGANTDTGRGPSTLTFVIEKHSLETFCALLRFIYTGDTTATVQLSQFVLSVNTPISADPNNNKPLPSSPQAQTQTQSLTRDSTSIRWLTSSEKSTWTMAKEEKLMLAAHEYGVDDLAAACQKRIESVMGEADVGHILFDIAPAYPKIKAFALQYVIRNKAAMFAPGKDVFARFTTYPHCHGVMMEILQLMAASK